MCPTSGRLTAFPDGRSAAVLAAPPSGSSDQKQRRDAYRAQGRVESSRVVYGSPVSVSLLT